uniref:Uncharacterized protein n=1 Tax=Glossina austeni TaxID=7395 RepID=A0A1A9UEV0_GLOAU
MLLQAAYDSSHTWSVVCGLVFLSGFCKNFNNEGRQMSSEGVSLRVAYVMYDTASRSPFVNSISCSTIKSAVITIFLLLNLFLLEFYKERFFGFYLICYMKIMLLKV